MLKIKQKWKKLDAQQYVLAVAGVAQLVGASSCEPKGRGFSAWSGHIRRFQIQSPVGGAQEATDVCFFLT